MGGGGGWWWWMVSSRMPKDVCMQFQGLAIRTLPMVS